MATSHEHRALRLHGHDIAAIVFGTVPLTLAG
jgi:hypothetical protein